MPDWTSGRDGDGRSTRMRLVGCLLLVVLLVAGTALADVARPDRPDRRAAGTDDQQSRLLVVVGPPGIAHYEIEVDGAIAPADLPRAAVDVEDEVNATTARGVVAGNGADAYRITGDVTSITLAGDATFLVDGERVSPDALASEWAVTFPDCGAVELSGDFASGYVFSTVVFPVDGPEGELLGFEENPVNEYVALSNTSGRLRAGSTLPTNVSNVTVVRSVFLYERPITSDVDPLLIEIEVADRVGQPAVRVENPAYDECTRALRQRLENRSNASTTAASASVAG